MHDRSHTAPPDPAARPARVLRVRETVWLFTLLVCVGIVYFSPLRNELPHVREVNDALDRVGPGAELTFIAGAALITALGFPRMLVYPAGGIAFGFLGGLAWSVVALLIGGYLPFCYARWSGRSWMVQRWPRMGRLADYFGERGYKTVILFRILPMPGFLTNAFLGITRIGHGAFLLGTLIGSIPAGIPATLLASGVLEEQRAMQIIHTTGSILLFLVLWFVIPFHLRKHPNIQLLREALAEPDAVASD
jgi:uncharacterized membrane protein YdjX (TVP38/TMEM64 family)